MENLSDLPCPDTIDQSMGSCLDSCPRAFLWEYIYNVVPLEEPDFFISGRAWDRAMATWEGKRGRVPPQKRYELAVEAINTVYDTANCRFFSAKRTRENLIELLSRYTTEFLSPPYRAIDSNVQFKFPYKDFFLAGELDRYLDWPEYGVVVGEDKTTTIQVKAKGFDSYLEGFNLGRYANQIRHYEWACLQITEKVWGTVITVASLDVPKRSSTERQLFQRIFKPLNPHAIQEYLVLCEDRMRRLRQYWEDWTWPKIGQNCTGSWGAHPCIYRWLCQMHQPVEDVEIPPSVYRFTGPWAPWEGRRRDINERRRGKGGHATLRYSRRKTHNST